MKKGWANYFGERVYFVDECFFYLQLIDVTGGIRCIILNQIVIAE